MSNIRLSPKHGVNASLGVCWLCGDDNGEVVLPGLLKGDVEAPRRAVWDQNPCTRCADTMKVGVILLEVTDGSKAPDVSDRTGRMLGISTDCARRLLQPEAMLDAVLRKRVAYISADAFGPLWDDAQKLQSTTEGSVT